MTTPAAVVVQYTAMAATTIADHIPADVWAETVFHMLDARDLITLAPPADSFSPGSAVFAAKRVLSSTERNALAALGVSVTLLVHRRPVLSLSKNRMRQRTIGEHIGPVRLCPPYDVWYLNDEIHRDGDLPAINCPYDGTKVWFQHGKPHRDGDRPALICGRSQWWFQRGKKHRDDDKPAVENDIFCQWWIHGRPQRGGNQPTVVFADGHREWWGSLPDGTTIFGEHGVI